MTPEAYKLLPEGKVPDGKPRRNLILISKILQVFFFQLDFFLTFRICQTELNLERKNNS
jgi:hypothetical protein